MQEVKEKIIEERNRVREQEVFLYPFPHLSIQEYEEDGSNKLAATECTKAN
jgi:hypothetical protein